ncbi:MULTISPECIES: HEPN domain-containing protein [unclassified Campylobacter]|uniref:HEPN domain-containing protein n=1 Tax=unclassified Campylobacter TaxID=2593542 RepID=UPI0024B55D47|nr:MULTISPECIES: HEPN domain-containing protein [unclassified Campylobacter]
MYNDFIKFNQAINDLSVKIDSLTKDDSIDMDIIDHLTKYLIILMSGYIEKFFEKTIKDCLDGKSIPKEIKNFINNNLQDITNLKPTKLKSILEKFDSAWKQQIEEKHANALGAIIKARNDIAHCNNTNISKQDYIKHFNTTKQMLEKIEQELFNKI